MDGKSQNKKRKIADDISEETTWKEFIKKIEKEGFVKDYKYSYKGFFFNQMTEDEIVIYCNEEKGLVLFAESYFNRNKINQIKVYGEIKAIKSKMTEVQMYASFHFKVREILKSTIMFNTENKVGLLTDLDIIAESFAFCTKWTKPFLPKFIGSEELMDKKLDFENLVLERIKEAKKVADIIGINKLTE
jgi:hypothetical protein